MHKLAREAKAPRARAVDARTPRPASSRNAHELMALQRLIGNQASIQWMQGVGPSMARRTMGGRLPRSELVFRACECEYDRDDTAARKPSADLRIARQQSSISASGGLVLQRVPGDGMLPPGDCSWGQYLILRGSVETAKAVVSMLGACSQGDSCLFLAMKIAAITAEIAARVALDTTCFKGGDTGHQQQVRDKVQMLNRCYRFFGNANCSPELIAAMAVVVEQARAAIAASAAIVAVALVVALVVAIVALVELIAAAAAAAAAAAGEAALIGAAAAALIALLVGIREQIGSGAAEPVTA